jgi:small-conductance mechanosensitive channel
VTVITDSTQAVLTAFSQALGTFFAFIPKLIGAIIVLLIGWLVGRLVGRLVTQGLRTVKFDQVAERTEIGPFLRNAGVQMDPAAVVGALARWFIYLVFWQAAAGILGFPQLSQILNEVLGFLPRIAVALVILLVGALAANLLARVVRGSLGTAHFGDAGMLAAIARYGVIAFAVVAALSQLDIAPAIVNTLWTAVIGSIALAFALAVGLGARDAMGNVASGQLIRTELEPGAQLTVNGQQATVERIGTVYATLQIGGRPVRIPNAELVRPGGLMSSPIPSGQVPAPVPHLQPVPADGHGQPMLVGSDGQSKL